MKTSNFPLQKNKKRQKVLANLEKQLKSGTKEKKKGEKIPLNDEDIKRINKHIETLKERTEKDVTSLRSKRSKKRRSKPGK